MTPPSQNLAQPMADRRALRLALALTGVATALRLAALRISPLQLYPDEAQYWLWSRHLAFGYFSKPPMVAWLIHLTTLSSDAEAMVRASSPILHAIAALALFQVGRALYDARVGAAACALYLLTPAAALSSFVVSTDPALMAFLALALWAYAALQTAGARWRRTLIAAGFGAALGLAFLSKYAAVYLLIGLGAHLAISPAARRAWSPKAALAAIAAFGAAVAPNLIWNAGHGFATVAHTAANADWRGGHLFNPVNLLTFLGSQFGVFGPIPFAVLVGGTAWLGWKRRLSASDLLLICFAAPPLLIVAGQAFVSRANANWAAAAYAPGAVLVGAWLLRRPRWLAAALAIQGLAAAGVLVFTTAPALADRVGLANSYKRVRGWRELTATLVERARAEDSAAALTAVAVDDRFFFNEAAYYGRGYFGVGGPPLTIWLKGAAAENQAELEAPLTPAVGVRVLAASVDGRNAGAMAADFASAKGREVTSTRLDQRHRRSVEMFLGEGFAPAPRAGVSPPRRP
jgi:4-amino-4-deoxy-L-arabinose transferase-like glycosyltransferase